MKEKTNLEVNDWTETKVYLIFFLEKKVKVLIIEKYEQIRSCEYLNSILSFIWCLYNSAS